MKFTAKHILLVAALPLACLCTKDPEGPGKKEEGPTAKDAVTINVTIPETKVSASPGAEATDPALVFSWEQTDKVLVKGTDDETFVIKEITDGHHASFTGLEVDGDQFSVYYPSDDILTRSYENQVQAGNASTSHLAFNAMASGLSDYKSVTFTKVNGAVKILVKVPASVTEVTSLSVTSRDASGVDQAVFYKTNDAAGEKTATFTLGFASGTKPADGILTAYAMVSWNEVELAAGSQVVVKLGVPDKPCIYQEILTLPQAVTVSGGQTAVLDLSLAEMQHAIGGSGTEADPYKICDVEDLLGMSELLDENNAKYFKLMNDIDMAGVDWTPASQGNTNYPYCQIFFDGDNHTISNLYFDKTGMYAGFIGVLWGKVSNITFVNPNITATKAAGVVCGYAGTTVSGTALPAEIENVNIVNGNVTQNGAAHLGLVFGNTNAPGKFTNIHTTGTVTLSSSLTQNNNNKAAAGGICGSCADAIFSKCSFVGTVNGGRTSGGLIGLVRETTTVTTSVTECWADAAVTLTKIGGIAGECGGGIAGYVKSATITNCYFKGSVTIATQMCGGIVGEAFGPEVTIANCWTSAPLKAARGAGGIVGRACNGSWTLGGTKCLDISNCVYWGSKIDVAAATSGNASSGAIVGYTDLTNVLKNCWRNPQIEFVNTGNEVNKPVDQPDCDGTNWAKSADTTTGEATQIGTGTSPQAYLFPYWGKASDAANVCATVLGKGLGWDTAIWNLTGDEPRLINNPEPVAN